MKLWYRLVFAKSHESEIGPSRHFAATQQFARFLGEADIEPPLPKHDLGMLEFWDDRRRRPIKSERFQPQ
jgi:hypothetical protein